MQWQVTHGMTIPIWVDGLNVENISVCIYISGDKFFISEKLLALL
ncbi:MAG: hypothetical protein Q4Q00_03315 [Turicibacter sp.]|nr:hypothetical protein [Turicibacter sp.]